MQRKFLITGAILGLIAVLFGAFAAHGLKDLLSVESIATFETGVKFQMYHALLFLILGSLESQLKKLNNLIFFMFLSGIILFSGSIYLLATNSLYAFDAAKIAMLTPLGGTILITGWGMLIWRFIKLKSK
ncbi:DUF423 domain-containing protein [Gramella sp. AN32]|uniref:DUF423 domain-containing protein n=1 Tax=Christiangramia antarctica TaxID=2058158 RepID=A0ABW5X9N3_9FLAO|nr:DUF423 domain-containing protein [Gramella sp. AN32]MCM4155413.1 DUF423 domain-containing protein [Gramella sp. AN32]